MWLVTKEGSFCIRKLDARPENAPGERYYQVCSRTRKDIENLQELMAVNGFTPNMIETPDDYPFRITLNKWEKQWFFDRLADSLDSENFNTPSAFAPPIEMPFPVLT